jgi:hypothetical protein
VRTEADGSVVIRPHGLVGPEYARYVAQGGDVGAVVTDNLGRLPPAGLLGIHMNLLVTALGGAQSLPMNTPEEIAAVNPLGEFVRSGGPRRPRTNRRACTLLPLTPRP